MHLDIIDGIKMIKLRKIKVSKLFISGIVYRLHIIILQSIFWYIFFGMTTGNWRWEWAISSSIIWNLFNTLLYYNYHYWFARLVKLGKE